jgi:hypothetical protein
MAKITEEMIENCFDIYFTENQDIDLVVQIGMNKSSAKMTMCWLRCLFDGELYKRQVPVMQVKWVLNKLYQTQDSLRLNNALKSLEKYCDFYENKPMIAIRNLVKEFEEKMPNSS